MKRHIQKTGVRKFFGQDFVDLQAEPLAVLDGFFAEYGACIIEGCAITEADGGTFDVASGLVALKAFDPNSGAEAIHVMPFEGINKVALPLYLVAEWVVVERAYGDGKVKPIAYNLRAVASGVEPKAPHLVLNAVGANRFVDALQDGTHRFVSDAERSKWNDILRQAKEYAAAQAQAAKGSSVEYTDQTAVALRDELALGDQAALRTAKEYADQIVAALVDNTPEALNTLQELATALGNNPNFATDVLQAIGERATIAQINEALKGKANTVHTHNSNTLDGVALNGRLDNINFNTFTLGENQGGVYRLETNNNAPASQVYNWSVFAQGNSTRGAQIAVTAYNGNTLYFRSSNGDSGVWYPWRELYHTGNLKIIRGSVDAGGGNGGGNAFSISPTGEPAVVRVTHNLGTTAYSATATVVSNGNNAHTDNVVSVWRKGADYVDFVVTAGPDPERELCAFDFIIIPH